MTKEEETIERLNKLKNRKILYGNRAGMIIEEFKTLQEDLETVLNMLKEKDRQRNSKNGTINALQSALKERTEERDRKDDIIAKQNKIIDLMTEQLAGLTIWDNEKEEPLILKDKEEVKQCFERKVKE